MDTCLFSRYSDALKNSIRQDEIMQQVMSMPNIEELWESDIVEEKMLSLIK
jgi:kynurenine 3-monooxygenase